MAIEEDIKQELSEKFYYLENKIRIARPRRIYLEVEQANFEEVFVWVLQGMKFSHLVAITGLDEQDKLSFIYHMAHDNGVVLNVKTSVDKDQPALKSMTKYIHGAEIYERELVDLFGAQVEGLPPGNRYPLTDDWPAGEYPLRKDWKWLT